MNWVFGFDDVERLTPELRAAAEAGDRAAQRRIRRAAEFGDRAAMRYLEAPFQWNAESPIERELLIAMSERALSRVVPEAYEDPASFLIEVEQGIRYRVATQVPIGRYRADIVLTQEIDDDVRIVIECDGREWHTKPEQIARDRKRDRFMERLGYTVLRFSGHDIHVMVERCADEVFRVAASIASEEA